MTKVYFPEVDAVKGIAILLVILGHSFCVYPINLVEPLGGVQKVIYSFHMPLFFIASGFVFSRAASWRELAVKKVHRLMVPWLAFSLLAMTLKIVFSSFTHSGEVDVMVALGNIVQGRSYWFLYSLMGLLVVGNLVRNDRWLWALAAVSVALGLSCDLMGFDHFSLGKMAYYLPFFVFGTLLRQHYGGANLVVGTGARCLS